MLACQDFDISEPIEKTRKKAGMLLNGHTDHRKTNPIIYILNCGKVCLSTLLFGAELWTLFNTNYVQILENVKPSVDT